MNLAGKGAPRVNYRLGRRDGIWLGKSQKTSHQARGKRVLSQRSGSVASPIMTTFRILFGIDALAAAVVAFFFVWGLSGVPEQSMQSGAWSVSRGSVLRLEGGRPRRRGRGGAARWPARASKLGWAMRQAIPTRMPVTATHRRGEETPSASHAAPTFSSCGSGAAVWQPRWLCPVVALAPFSERMAGGPEQSNRGPDPSCLDVDTAQEPEPFPMTVPLPVRLADHPAGGGER